MSYQWLNCHQIFKNNFETIKKIRKFIITARKLYNQQFMVDSENANKTSWKVVKDELNFKPEQYPTLRKKIGNFYISFF